MRQWWERESYPTINNEPSATDTSHGNETDINRIMERFDRDGILPPMQGEPVYMDVTDLQGDLTEMYNEAQETLQTARDFVSTWNPDAKPTEPTNAPDTPPGAVLETAPV